VRRTNTASHNWGVSYRVSAGTAAIDSDFIYARHEAKAGYTFVGDPHSIQIDFLAGRITGNAPMIERFSIGNARTLRGWNKYEIDPLGGNRVVYGSATYRYKIIGGFYDVGSVWDAGQSRVVRQSAGVKFSKSRCGRTFIMPHPDCFSLAVGFPIHGDRARPALMLGLGL
jgi:outer membrane translocation and assembly module TamA